MAGPSRNGWAKAARDFTIFLVGILGIVYEALFAERVSEVLVFAFLAMMGIVPLLRMNGK